MILDDVRYHRDLPEAEDEAPEGAPLPCGCLKHPSYLEAGNCPFELDIDF